MEQPSDDQIQKWAERIKKSEKEAFDSLFRSYFPQLVNYAYRFTHGKASARDIVQDVFIDLWWLRQSIDADRSLKAWLYRSVRNRTLNHIRDQKEIASGDIEFLNNHANILTPPADDPEVTDDLLHRIHEWISELPPRQREAFELSRFDGLDHEEIAGVMNISEKTVNNHIVAALQNLRHCYRIYLED